MTDTDAGKMLNDAELAEITARNNIEKNYRAVYNEVISGADADVAKLLSHIAALTANRGSVSEEQIDAALHAHVPGGSEVWVWLPQKDAFTPSETARDVIRVALEAAIQQAVSECSGGGAEGIVVPKAFAGRVAIAKSWDGWLYHLECVAGRFTTEDGYQRFPDPELVLPESLLKSNCNECRKPMLAALPLPPSPVKESRDAVIEECANRVLEVSQTISSGFIEKHCPYCEEGRIGASNTGFYAANSIRLLKSTS